MVDGLYDMSDTCESARASCGLCKLACMDTLSLNFSFVSFRVLLLDAAVLARLIRFLWRFMYDYNISMPPIRLTVDPRCKIQSDTVPSRINMQMRGIRTRNVVSLELEVGVLVQPQVVGKLISLV